jgi:hypothetical protein
VSSLVAILDALAAQIETQLTGKVENLAVTGRLVPNPTPPAIDIYPADPFTEAFTYGPNPLLFFTVRARVTTADNQGGQELLLSMMDSEEDTSVEKAILSSRTLGGKVTKASVVAGPSSFGVFVSPQGEVGSLLGCTWTVQITP